MKSDHRSKFSNLSSWREEYRRSLKKIRALTGFEPVTSAIPVRCSTHWAMSYDATHWDLAPNVWLHSSVGRASHRYHEVTGYELWAMSYEATHWDLAPNVWLHSSVGRASHRYHEVTGYELWAMSYEATHWDLAPNVWLHSSVGRASHRYHEVTGSNPVEALIFFRLLLSNCLIWKIYCDDHSSLLSTTAVQIWIISYVLHH